VDFRKALDTVRYEELLYKLRLYGVSDLFNNVIKNMYSQTYLSVKVDPQSITDSIQSFIGVRQGNNLNSMSFNLFINDILSIFDHYCAPVQRLIKIKGMANNLLVCCTSSLEFLPRRI
jgi:hypothetical protein